MTTETEKLQDWRSEFPDRSEALEFMKNSGKYTDCQFLVGPEESEQQVVSAHKVILAAASPVFEKMFFGELKEEEKLIVVPDIEAKIFKLMATFIYTSELECAYEEYFELFYAGQKYMIKNLQDFCRDEIIEGLDAQNVLQTFEWSNFYDDSDVKICCLKLIKNEWQEVLKSSFADRISPQTLQSVVELLITAVDTTLFHQELFSFIEKFSSVRAPDYDPTIDYIKLKPKKEVEESIYRTLRLVDYKSFDKAIFLNGPGKCKMITTTEAFALYALLTCPTAKHIEYPEGFVRYYKK